MTTRREAVIALPLLCAAFHARAQASKTGQPRRIGILELSDTSQTREIYAAFWDAMSKLGWILDKNVVVERPNANGQAERLAGLADELIRKRVDVILCVGQAAPVAATRATQTVPIVFFGTFSRWSWV